MTILGSVKSITLADVALSVAALFKPPERLEVHEASAKYRHLENPPVYSGPYDNNQAPYMVEPMNMTQSRDHTSVVFVGPAQSGKTEAIILNVVAYSVKCNPMDVILYHMSQSAAGDFSERRVNRMHRQSKAIGSELGEGQHSDNTFRKLYKSGMMFTISWPSINEMSSKPIPMVMFTDYDRMPDDIGGEGSPFTLGKKRTQTFRNFGMTIVDTSPGRAVEDPKAIVKGHAAPPCTGALGLYNQGDRRRWFWPCPHCDEFFEPSFKLLVYDVYRETEDEDGERVRLSDLEIEHSAYMACPHNGCRIEHHHKKEMNKRGVWLCEGEKITSDGVRYGTPRRSRSATYWLKGPAANFISWGELVVKYVNAEESYEQTQDETILKAVVNTDLGEPYIPKSIANDRVASDIMDTATGRPMRLVPEDVRALFATVDVQKNRWEVQVQGVRPGRDAEGNYVDGLFDVVVIDRFPIIKSERKDEDGERLWVKPATEADDWKLLVTQVMDKTYELQGQVGEMGISMTLCDSGGKAGVTTMAYNFYRYLVKEGRHNKFHLVKGEPKPNAPRVAIDYPDTQRKDRMAEARGEIPVMFINSNIVKDLLNGMLDQKNQGKGKVEFPDGLDIKFYEELVAEVKTKKGWENVAKRRNEAWDLLVYFLAGLISRRIESVQWHHPPTWLKDWESNPEVVLKAVRAAKVDKPQSVAHRARNLAAELNR